MSKTKTKERWAYSTNEEDYSGSFDSREEAVAEVQTYGEGTYYVGKCVPPPPPEDRWYAEDWLEHVSVQDDYSHECAEDWDRSTRDQLEELEAEVRAVMAGWLDRHDLRPRFYIIEPESVVEVVNE